MSKIRSQEKGVLSKGVSAEWGHSKAQAFSHKRANNHLVRKSLIAEKALSCSVEFQRPVLVMPLQKYERASPVKITGELATCSLQFENQKNSRRLWRSRRRKSSSVPEGAAYFPAAVFLAGKCPNLGRHSISRCRKENAVIFLRLRFWARQEKEPTPAVVGLVPGRAPPVGLSKGTLLGQWNGNFLRSCRKKKRTMRHKNITYPKKVYPNYCQSTVTRSEFFFFFFSN